MVLKSQKHVFWQALVLALIVFGIGILLGFLLENSRTRKVKDMYFQSELDLIDIKIHNEIFSFPEIQCRTAIAENIAFADRVYEEGKLFDKYERANKLSESVVLQHKKFDLLRTLFWVNAIKLKHQCNAEYHNVVYFYQYQDPSVETRAKQGVFSRLLGEIKEEKGGKVMLIPIAADNNLSSVSLLMRMYNVSENELPVILIDEEIKVTEITDKQDVLDLLTY